MNYLKIDLEINRLSADPNHHFFGYYDKSPWDQSGRYVLALESTFNDRAPKADDVAKVCVIDTQSDCRLDVVDETLAWNWQQGTMLQWMPNSTQTIIYNNRVDGRFVSVIHHLSNGRKRVLPLPIYTLSHSGKYALSLNFARLAKTRPGYGYEGLQDPYESNAAPADDGIYSINLETGEYRLLISLAQIAAFQPRKDMQGAKHWFNHLLFRPDDERFIFLHRWVSTIDGKRKTRLFTANRDGSEIYLVSDHDMTSHFDWRDNDHILAWARRKGEFNWLRPHHRHYRIWLKESRDDFYLVFKDKTQCAEIIGKGILLSDGHCTYSPNREWILTDTYPDGEGMRTLLLYHEKQQRRIDIGRFYSPPQVSSDVRCDLHPRWSPDGTKVCIDSTHEGQRQMYSLDVSEIVNRSN